MSDDKKYYYLKLKDNFFDREEITVIESMLNGYKYSNILLKMYLKSLKREGKLMVTDYIPYNLQTLSAVLKHDEDTLRTAIELFKDFRLIEVLDNGQIYMNDIQNFVGLSSTEADRKREYRAKIEHEILNELPSGQMSDKCPKGVRKKSDKNPPEKELKKEKELKTKYSEFVFLTGSEYNRFITEFGEDATKRLIEILNNYKGANGKKYASDNLAIRSWVIDKYRQEQSQTKLFADKPKTVMDKAKEAAERYAIRHGITTSNSNERSISVIEERH